MFLYLFVLGPMSAEPEEDQVVEDLDPEATAEDILLEDTRKLLSYN
jgi:hypothetical protein